MISCSSLPKEEEKIELHFLDEYVYPINKKLKDTKIGGLSGIDYKNGVYYLAVDDSRMPRYCKATIVIENNAILDIKITDVVIFKDDPFYQYNFLDLESIIAEPNNKIIMVSEGSIKKGEDPLLFSTKENGDFIQNFQIPNKFLASADPKPIHNKTLEGLSHSFDNQGYWTAFELPLPLDGKEPIYQKANSPVRFTYFDKETGVPTKEFVYQLSPITKPNRGDFNLNGVTDILEFKTNHFFVIERTYQSEYGAYGNTVNIYHAYVDDSSTNSLDIDSLKNTDYIPLNKEILFEFDTIKSELTEGIIDNIEGITFGPVLNNGNQSLILVSDDNFQVYGKQLNQFILLEIKK
tara:strand:- start:16462 stop:17511 length:1050 start_codon:yes stop_codon:yes gene_type:complete